MTGSVLGSGCHPDIGSSIDAIIMGQRISLMNGSISHSGKAFPYKKAGNRKNQTRRRDAEPRSPALAKAGNIS